MNAKQGCFVLSGFLFFMVCVLPMLLNALIASPWRVIGGEENVFIVDLDPSRFGEYDPVVYWQTAPRRLVVHRAPPWYIPGPDEEVLIIDIPARQVQWLPFQQVKLRQEEQVNQISNRINQQDNNAPGTRLYPSAAERKRHASNDYFGILLPKVQYKALFSAPGFYLEWTFYGSRRLTLYSEAAAPVVELRKGIFDGAPGAPTFTTDMTWLPNGRYFLLQAYSSRERRLLIVDTGATMP